MCIPPIASTGKRSKWVGNVERILAIGAIAFCALLAGCTITPIRDRGEEPTGAGIADVLGESGAVESDAGKLLASETMSETVSDVVSSDRALSTPELIDKAFANGEITAGEHTLYLAYAIYDYSALPAVYQSSTPWRGTMIVADIKEAAASPQFCAYSPEVQQELRRLLADSVEFPQCP